MKKTILLAVLLAATVSCSDSDTYQDIETPETQIPPKTDPPVINPPAPITYAKNVKSIIDASCVGCHQNGRSAGFRPLTTFAEVKAAVQNSDLLGRIQLQNGQQGIMPQAGRMSQANIDLIVKWNTDGLKEN